MDSGASLDMVTKNELTSDEKDTIRRSEETTVITKGRVDGRCDSVCQRFGRFCRHDAVGRFTALLSLVLLREEIGYSYDGKRRVSIDD